MTVELREDASTTNSPPTSAAGALSDPAELPDPAALQGVSGRPAPEPATVPGGASRRTAAAPAVRARARELGLDLADVLGTGPDGRVTHADLDRYLLSGRQSAVGSAGTGELLHSAEPAEGADILRPTTATTTVTLRTGSLQVQDGPFDETGETLAGVVVLDVPELGAALAWAEKCPAARTARPDRDFRLHWPLPAPGAGWVS